MQFEGFFHVVQINEVVDFTVAVTSNIGEDAAAQRGFIEAVDAEAGEIRVRFDDKHVEYGTADLDALVPAYAVTIHKSQGSEYPAVVIPVLIQHYAMLQRNLLYTAITRGKRLVVLVGDRKAVAIAVRNVPGRRRWSKLRDWLSVMPQCQ